MNSVWFSEIDPERNVTCKGTFQSKSKLGRSHWGAKLASVRPPLGSETPILEWISQTDGFGGKPFFSPRSGEKNWGFKK